MHCALHSGICSLLRMHGYGNGMHDDRSIAAGGPARPTRFALSGIATERHKVNKGDATIVVAGYAKIKAQKALKFIHARLQETSHRAQHAYGLHAC